MSWQRVGTAYRADGAPWAVYKMPGHKPYYKARPDTGVVPMCDEGGYYTLQSALEAFSLANYAPGRAP